MHEALRDERRFTPRATVPLQDGKLAAEVLGEAMEQGFGGIGALPKGYSGGNLDDLSLDPFWETASNFDSCVFDTDSLEYRAHKAGMDRVMPSSDAPFPIGDPEPLRVFDGAAFTPDQKQAILGDIAQEVFRLRTDHLRKN